MPPEEDHRNCYTVPEFCRRQGIAITTAYRANRARLLDFTKVFGKTVVTAESEAKFLKLAAEGKLIWPKEPEPAPAPDPNAKRRRGRPRKIPTQAAAAPEREGP